MPFGVFEFWQKLQVVTGLKYGWIILVWGLFLAILRAIVTRYSWAKIFAEKIVVHKAGTALFAGVFEEIVFRWIFFLNAIWIIKLANWLLFGFAGRGIIQWVFQHIITPTVDYSTLGRMTELLYHPYGWFVAAAMIIANTKFSISHWRKGWFALVNSWFGGMFFFWLMFNTGLIVCLAIHFIYDLITDIVWYIDVKIESAREVW